MRQVGRNARPMHGPFLFYGVCMAHSTKQWSKAKADYETGNFSVQELQKKYRISESSINKRIAKENWQKGKLKPVIEEEQRKRVLDALTEKGVDADMIADKIKMLLAAKRKLIIPNGDGPPIEKETDDYWAIDKGIAQFAKFTGGYAPTETRDIRGLIFEIVDPRK